MLGPELCYVQVQAWPEPAKGISNATSCQRLFGTLGTSQELSQEEGEKRNWSRHGFSGISGVGTFSALKQTGPTTGGRGGTGPRDLPRLRELGLLRLAQCRSGSQRWHQGSK